MVTTSQLSSKKLTPPRVKPNNPARGFMSKADAVKENEIWKRKAEYLKDQEKVFEAKCKEEKKEIDVKAEVEAKKYVAEEVKEEPNTIPPFMKKKGKKKEK